MATAIEMTIGLGRTLYGAPQGDTDYTIENETIEGRETRVSVTWRLTGDEHNLPLTASLLAEKAVQALETAEQTIRGSSQSPKSTQVPNAVEAPRQQEAVSEQEQIPAPSQPASGPLASVVAPTNSAATNGAGYGPAASGSTAYGSNSYGNGSRAASRSHPSSPAPRITNAQRLAIQSLCTRQGIADWELRRVMWEQFTIKEQSDLTKEQAGELLNILQQSAAEGNAHAYA